MFNYTKHLLGTRSVWQQPTPFACFPIQTNLGTLYVFYNSIPLSLSKPPREKNLLCNARFWRTSSIRAEEKLRGVQEGWKYVSTCREVQGGLIGWKNNMLFNPLAPNDPYMNRTAPLTSKRWISYIYSTNVGAEYFKHALYSSFFLLFKMQFVS